MKTPRDVPRYKWIVNLPNIPSRSSERTYTETSSLTIEEEDWIIRTTTPIGGVLAGRCRIVRSLERE